MGKPGGGSRPIALMPMIYRLWTKIRRPYMRQWEREQYHGPWDAAVRGSSALRAAIFTAFGDEVAQYNGKRITKILWDFEKFYDSLSIPRLIAKCLTLGYPVKLAALGIIMHTAPRTIRAYDHHVMMGRPSNGIIAGCTQSNHFARIFLHAIISSVHEASPYNDQHLWEGAPEQWNMHLRFSPEDLGTTSVPSWTMYRKQCGPNGRS